MYCMLFAVQLQYMIQLKHDQQLFIITCWHWHSVKYKKKVNSDLWYVSFINEKLEITQKPQSKRVLAEHNPSRTYIQLRTYLANKLVAYKLDFQGLTCIHLNMQQTLLTLIIQILWCSLKLSKGFVCWLDLFFKYFFAFLWFLLI